MDLNIEALAETFVQGLIHPLADFSRNYDKVKGTLSWKKRIEILETRTRDIDTGIRCGLLEMARERYAGRGQQYQPNQRQQEKKQQQQKTELEQKGYKTESRAGAREKRCFRCGSYGHLRDTCKEKEDLRWKCHKPGNRSSECPGTQGAPRAKIQECRLGGTVERPEKRDITGREKSS